MARTRQSDSIARERRVTVSRRAPQAPKAELKPDLISQVLTDLAGGKSLRASCVERNFSMHVFYDLLNSNPDIRERYARARTAQAHLLAEECVEIADTDIDPNRARVRVDARKWFASKVLPKVYGDKLQLEDVTPPLSDEEIERRILEKATFIKALLK